MYVSLSIYISTGICRAKRLITAIPPSLKEQFYMNMTSGLHKSLYSIIQLKTLYSVEYVFAFDISLKKHQKWN